MNSDVKFKIAFRKVKQGNRTIYRVQIREQHSRNIHFKSQTIPFILICSGTPQIDYTGNCFFLRGSSKSSDHNWVMCPEETLAMITITLAEYARSYGWSIEKDISADTKELVIWITRDNLANKIDENIVAKLITMLNFSTDDELTVVITCESCNIESDKCKPVQQGSRYTYICPECYKKMSPCDMCKNMNQELIQHTNSLGKERKVCTRCYKLSDCMQCQYKELSLETKIIRDIDPDGKDMTAKVCQKCLRGSSQCKSCGHYYPKTLPKCSCKIPNDFKGWIHPYNADVTQHLPADPDAELGMEIEVGVHCKNRVQFEDIYNHTMNIIKENAIPVYDSSIDYLDREAGVLNCWRGFEIVTRPLNRENMIEFVVNLTNKRHTNLRSWDVGTAGVHIHFNRKKLTRMEIGKLLVFINEGMNRHMVKHVARRYNAKFAKLRKKKITGYKDMRRECHYDALNTNKKFTIEFRIFRGSLNKETILSYIDFVYAAIQFVRVTPVYDKNKRLLLTYTQFLKWISSTPRSQYRHLKERLKVYGKRGQLEVGGEA